MRRGVTRVQCAVPCVGVGGIHRTIPVWLVAAVVGLAAGVTGALYLTGTDSFSAAFAAIAVALVTVWATDRRQEAQLAHDRRLHDLGELRAVLGSAGDSLFEAYQQVGTLEWHWSRPAEDRKAIDNARTAAFDAHTKAKADWVRLSIRLPASSPVPDSYYVALTSLETARKETHKARTPETTAGFETLKVEVIKQQSIFLEAARRLVGSEAVESTPQLQLTTKD